MNKAVVWLKGNWVIVLLAVISLAVIPTAWYFSNQMRTQVRDDLQKKVQEDAKEISNAKVTYQLMNVVGDKILDKSMEPTKAYTEWYKAEWEKIRSRTGTVSEAALAFNKGDHTVLVPDLFPDPQDFIAEAKLREFAAAYIRAHPGLLASINAGPPADADVLSSMLTEYQIAETGRIKNQTGSEPTDEGKKQIADAMRDMRLREYQRRAAQINLYAGPEVFFGVPDAPPTARPSAAQCWDWQERYWIHADICRAIGEANKAASGQGVSASAVKRIIRIEARPAAYLGGEGKPASAIPTEETTDKAPVDFSASLTGRVSGPGSKNKWYDVRNVRIELVVSSLQLPLLFDALAATNFMTVLDMDIFRVDPVEELKSGYYYGDADPVVRAVLEVETVFLREWRKDLMPAEVRAALGLVEGVTSEDPSAAAPPPPAPRRPAPPAGDGGDEDARPGRGRRGGGGD